MSTTVQVIKMLAKTTTPKYSIIFLHGLGDSGNGWSFLAEQLRNMNASLFNQCSFIFPTAPVMPITANAGYPMNAWFDLPEWDPEMRKFDNDGYKLTLTTTLQSLVQEQLDSGIEPQNIVLGGFSQGAAMTLGAVLTLPWKIGGFISLSGFVSCQKPLFDECYSAKNKDTPIFHGHGDMDPVVSLKKGQESRDWLVKNYQLSNYKFNVYSGLPHSLDPRELQDIYQFLVTLWS